MCRNQTPWAAQATGLTLAALVPEDENLFRFDLEGKPIVELPDDSPSVSAVFEMLDAFDIP